MQLRRATTRDLELVWAIEQASSQNPWSRQGLQDELGRVGSAVTVAVEGDTVFGFVAVWRVMDELHVLNVAVDPRARRRGIGRTLLAGVLAEAVAKGCRVALLEVRRSNAAAISLYRSAGFTLVGERPGYYQDREDALMFTRHL